MNEMVNEGARLAAKSPALLVSTILALPLLAFCVLLGSASVFVRWVRKYP